MVLKKRERLVAFCCRACGCEGRNANHGVKGWDYVGEVVLLVSLSWGDDWFDVTENGCLG